MTAEDAARQRRLQELSHFLRTRRAKISPSDLGFTTNNRRRTPGLRREEVAVLAGVGTSWYTWLEQGRDINVSESVVGSISRALRLSPSEDAYLFRLVGLKSPEDRKSAGDSYQDPRRLAQIVDGWFPYPALVKDVFWNILAANSAVPEFLGFDGAGDNILFTFFTDSSCYSRYRDPVTLAENSVARFRADVADFFGNPKLEELSAKLCAQSEEFARLWKSHEVLEVHKHRTKEMAHPRAGRISFDVHAWNLTANDHVQLILHMPSDDETKKKLNVFFQAGPEKAPDRPEDEDSEDSALR